MSGIWLGGWVCRRVDKRLAERIQRVVRDAGPAFGLLSACHETRVAVDAGGARLGVRSGSAGHRRRARARWR